MSQEKFDRLVALYRTVEFLPGLRRGTVIITDDDRRNLIRELLDDPEDEFGLVLVDGDVDGDQVTLEINDPKLAIGVVAADTQDLLSAPKALIRERPRYFIIDSKFCNTDVNVPDSILRYRAVLKLISLLKEAAAYLDEESLDLIFVQQGKFDLPVQYDANDLNKLDIAICAQLQASFVADIHKDQKLAILAKSIQANLSGINRKARFKHLLEQIGELTKSYTEGYRLFVADFSYEKIVNQLEVAKLEEIGKIHKTFSDIQNQILGIPVATVIVATQMKATTTFGYEFWVNTAVLVGCWVFVLLSGFVLRNQLHTLTAIEGEIARKKTQMLKEYKAIEDLITKSFPLLEQRLAAQRRAFKVVGAVLFIGLLMSHIVYIVFTIPIQHLLFNVYLHVLQVLDCSRNMATLTLAFT